VTEEVAVKEAIECMKPFKVKFKEVHWWTLYTIGQRIARGFSAKDRIFLCGDAAHTHSSGAAQGLNTGIHDAVNLGWKLALQIRGITQDSVLTTYSPERMTAVQKLIDYDRDIATLMSRKWPVWYQGDTTEDPYLLLGEIFEQAASFNTGLGISYPANVVNNQPSPMGLHVVPGARPPDVELTMPGTNQKIRFQRVTRNVGKFWVVVCTGNIESTRPMVLSLDQYIRAEVPELKDHEAVGWVTLTLSVECSPYEAIGMKPFGDTYYDPTNMAHGKFGIEADKGGILVLRPDGLLGSAGPLEGLWLKEYFSHVLKLSGKKGVNGHKA